MKLQGDDNNRNASNGAAPPVYRPVAQSFQAPPVYRPVSQTPQMKAGAATCGPIRPSAPPVYRPSAASQLKPVAATRLAAPPPYQPFTRSSQLKSQLKVAAVGTIQRAQAVASVCPKGHNYWGDTCHICPPAPVAVPVVAVDPYGAAVTLKNETVVDFPVLTLVMSGVTQGEEVTPSVWRAMRQELSEAITLKNKSHPAHGSNFNKNQRPEVQIVDWAKPIAGELKEVLSKYFQTKWDIYLK